MLVVLKQKVLQYSTSKTFVVDVIVDTDDIRYIRYSDCQLRVVNQNLQNVARPITENSTLVDIIYKDETMIPNIVGSVGEIYDIVCKASK